MKIRHMLLPFMLLLSISGCNSTKEAVTVSDFSLDTYISVTVYDDSLQPAAQSALNMCSEYESIFSRTDSDSELSRLNSLSAASSDSLNFEASAKLAELTAIGISFADMTDGALDITVEPLTTLWNINGENPHVPDDDAISDALEKVDYTQLAVSNNIITVAGDATLDFGAIAKGYIADNIKSYLTSNGVTNGIINLGGNILCIGGRPDGSPYKIGIQKPFSNSGETLLVLSIKDMSVVSSGTYERNFYENDILYHHIISPYDGYPATTGLCGVTIISEKSVDGDCLSTACLVLGLEKAITLIDSLENVYAIFITDDNQVYYSNGAKQFILAE